MAWSRSADGSLIFDTGIDESGFDKGVNSLSTAAGVALGNITADIIANISAAVAEIPKQMVAIGSAYEASMSQVAATMGITAGTEAYEQLAQAAKDAGNSTRFSASEASSALNFLALSGMNAAESVEALPTVLNTAAAAGMDLAAASDLITDAMSALGLEMSDLTTFSDQLAATAKSSNTSVAQLGEGILTVGGTAKILSGGITELNTALGILADNGIKGAEGGTTLRNIILSLSAPTNTAAAALESLGLSASLAFDETGAMRELPDIVGDLNTALAELSDQDRTAVLSEIFNKTDLKAVNALLGTSAERFDELSGKIDNAEGAAAQMAATMNDNLRGDLTMMQSALEGLGIAAYEHFQEPLRDAVQKVTAAIGDLTQSLTDGALSDSFNKVASGLADIAGAALQLVANDVLPAVINAFAWLIDNGKTLITVIGSVTAAVVAYEAAMKIAAVATNAEAIALAALEVIMSINPLFIALAAAVGLATAAAVVFTTTSDEATFSAESLTDKIQDETDSIRDQREALEELKRIQDEKIAADDAEANNIERLWKELQNYVDESGNVISNNKRANEIIGLLNDNYNMNIGYIDGQIQGYQELAGSMDDYLENLRRESRIRNGQEAYDAAVAQYDDLIKQRDELLAQEESTLELWEKQANAGEIEAANFKGNVRAGMQAELAELEAAIAGCEEEMGEFESLFTSTVESTAENAADSAAGAADDLGNDLVDTTQSLKDAWEQAQHDYAVGTIETEEELYDTLNKIWDDFGDANNKDHWGYYEKLKKHDKEYAEDQIKQQQKAADELKKQQEKEIEDKIAAVKLKKDLNDDFTEEMMYDEIETIISGLDKESDIYQKYNTEILKGRKGLADAMTAEAEKQSKELKTTIGKDLDSILSEYQKAFNELENKRQSYKQKLMSVGGSLFSTDEIENEDGSKTKKYVINNLDEQIKAMRKYHDNVKNLKDRNVSDSLLSELTALSNEDSQQFAAYLSSMSDAELAKINELYSKKDEIADELSKDMYSKETQNLQDAMVAALVDSSQNYGKKAADNYIDAFKAAFEDRQDEFAKLFDGIDIADILTGGNTVKTSGNGSALSTVSKTASNITAKRDNIKSAASEGISDSIKESDEVSEAVETAFEGVPESAYQCGEQSAEMFMEGFREELSRLYNQFAAEQINVSASITAGQNPQGNYGGSSWSGSRKEERIIIENRDEITVKVDRDVLGKTVNEWTKEYERRTGT